MIDKHCIDCDNGRCNECGPLHMMPDPTRLKCVDKIKNCKLDINL